MLDPSIKRSDVPEEFTWRLEDMYPTDSMDMGQLQEMVKDREAW